MSKFESIFTEEETQFIINNYGEMTSNEIAEKLGFTVEQIRSRINFLGIRKQKCRFTKEEFQYIKENYPNKSVEEIAVYLNKTTKQVQDKIHNSGLNKNRFDYLYIDGQKTNIINVIGQKYNRLTIIKFHKRNKNNKYYWECKCECGSDIPVYATVYDLKSGRITSCGCLRNEILRVKNSKIFTKSFEDWCIENNKQRYLELWDYKLNKKLPNEVAFQSEHKFYFKCPQNKHESELYIIKNLIKHKTYDVMCIKCNSFAQYGIDNICSDFLEKYWDYNKNKVNPWEIAKGSTKKVWIYCQEKPYHDSYYMTCDSFYFGARCQYCSMQKIHKLDSLGTLYPKVFDVWSIKNKKSPYEIAPKSSIKKYWYKCENGIHKDYKRANASAVRFDFRCPECNYSRGENKISELLINNKINYNAQQPFEGLVGLGNGLLTYDFYLKDKYNLLIEYQGEQHDHYIEGFHRTYADFEKQLEHDRRKRQYAKDNNIKLLEIWYWDFDNIEEILVRELELN